jgi:hypothetical protein
MKYHLVHCRVLIVAVGALGCRHQPPSPPPSPPSVTSQNSQEVAMSDAPATSPSSNPAPRQPQVFTGTLRGRVMAVGGETTGWRLERDDGKRVDVNVAKVRDALDGLDGKRVVIHGTLTQANWVERGRQPLLMADRIEPEPTR